MSAVVFAQQHVRNSTAIIFFVGVITVDSNSHGRTVNHDVYIRKVPLHIYMDAVSAAMILKMYIYWLITIQGCSHSL